MAMRLIAQIHTIKSKRNIMRQQLENGTIGIKGLGNSICSKTSCELSFKLPLSHYMLFAQFTRKY